MLHRLDQPSRSPPRSTGRLHPELGLRLVDRLSPHLGRPHAGRAASSPRRLARQQRLGRARCSSGSPSSACVIMGHTHQAALRRPPRAGRHYLNPGAWFDGFRYASPTESGAELRQLHPSGTTSARSQPLADEPRADLTEARLVVAHRKPMRRRRIGRRLEPVAAEHPTPRRPRSPRRCRSGALRRPSPAAAAA